MLKKAAQALGNETKDQQLRSRKRLLGQNVGGLTREVVIGLNGQLDATGMTG